tara:strand:- start:1979 stop:2221 length:243 start_codon:yes stop_codon:yes gene_type:complete
MEKEFRKILAEISGYTEQELTDRHTEPLIQPYDCLLAMIQALTIHSVVVPKGTLCNKNENKLGMCNCCGDNNCHDDFCKG